MKPAEQKSPKQAPPKKLNVPPREKLADLTHAQLVALRDSLRGQPKSVADKSYRRAVRVLERALRAGKKSAAKPKAAKKAAKASPTEGPQLRKAA